MYKMVIDRESLLSVMIEINRRLQKQRKRGEIILYNDTAMSFTRVWNEPFSTIEARCYPFQTIKEMFKEEGFKEVFSSEIHVHRAKHENIQKYKEFSNLKIYVALTEYILAMKIKMARCEDLRKIEYLLKETNIETEAELEKIVYRYYQPNQIDERMIGEVAYRFLK